MKALLTGVTGQDGSYLAELLLAEGYEVHGIIRRASSFNTGRIERIRDDLTLHYGDLSDGSSLARLIGRIQPDHIYNLGAQSHVRVSFDCPEYTCDIGAMGTLRLLEAIRENHAERSVRFYQASSSEMFGTAPAPQGITTPFLPQSPYACAKVFAYHLVQNYREAYGMHASNGILFNHESPRRGPTFVTRKITIGLNRIKAGLQEKLLLGNLGAKRDWGHARDYVRAMYLMTTFPSPGDWVVATGEIHSVECFLDAAAECIGIDWRDVVDFDPRLLRPTEVPELCGDSWPIRSLLGWSPQYSFHDLVAEMCEADRVTGDGAS